MYRLNGEELIYPEENSKFIPFNVFMVNNKERAPEFLEAYNKSGINLDLKK